MHNDYANSRWGAPRRLGIGALLLGILIAMMVAFSGGASAAPGDADLSITKTDSPDSVVQGNNLTYTITVTNHGPLAATNVVVTDNLPAKSDVDFVSATSAAGSCGLKGSTVTCNLDTLANAGTATVTIVVKTKHSGTLSNRATVASPDDNTPANNTATATTTVTGKGNQPAKASCATPSITGTPGNDVLVGTAGNDVILALAGDDAVFSGGGSDLICAGIGNDLVASGAGGDKSVGGPGRDRLKGGRGPDLLKGKAGRDQLRGQRGNDFLSGGRGFGSCKGGAGRDSLVSCP